ncbi:hypothetical protein PBI_SCTP2_440 [Salicola phage SCTP-2]|nr:hypothetical protein PBI_SCTP2_440 [Salicola phage SCTP-2]
MSEQTQIQEQETEQTETQMETTETTSVQHKGNPGRPLSEGAQKAQDEAINLAEAGERFTADQIQEASGASKAVVRNRLNVLVKQGVLQQSKGEQRKESRGRPSSVFEKA